MPLGANDHFLRNRTGAGGTATLVLVQIFWSQTMVSWTVGYTVSGKVAHET
jgi:hypothetical protein